MSSLFSEPTSNIDEEHVRLSNSDDDVERFEDEGGTAGQDEPAASGDTVSIKLVSVLLGSFNDPVTGERFVRNQPKEVSAEDAERLLKRRRGGKNLFVRA